MKTDWISYNELAWVDAVLSSPDELREEAEFYCKLITEKSKRAAKTLLHFGCGAGMHDHTFKRHFEITGVDLSEGMLKIARSLNPEIEYHRGDMRGVRLSGRYDAVAIPDSIAYMATVEDLKSAVRNAERHLDPGGVLLIVCQTKDEFRENNFAYTGSHEDVQVTLFENNFVTRPDRSQYEASIVYLIRRKGKLRIRTDVHTLGLYDKATWLNLLKEEGFDTGEFRMDSAYDRYLLGEGKYPQTVFVGVK